LQLRQWCWLFDMPQWWRWRISLCSRLTVTVPTTSVHTPVLTGTISYTGCLLPYPVNSGHQQNREHAGWSMLAVCDKRDGQTFTGWKRRPTSFGRMLCTSESHERMQCLGTVDVNATELEGGWVVKHHRPLVMLQMCLHSPQKPTIYWEICHQLSAGRDHSIILWNNTNLQNIVIFSIFLKHLIGSEVRCEWSSHKQLKMVIQSDRWSDRK